MLDKAPLTSAIDVFGANGDCLWAAVEHHPMGCPVELPLEIRRKCYGCVEAVCGASRQPDLDVSERVRHLPFDPTQRAEGRGDAHAPESWASWTYAEHGREKI